MSDAAAPAPNPPGGPAGGPAYADRLERAAVEAADSGLAGLIVTPGPDLDWLTGYRPPPTERLTALLVVPGERPRLLVPALERPGAERAPSAASLSVTGWSDGQDPYAALAPLLGPKSRYGVSDNAWALHLLGLQRACPEVSYGAFTEVMPMLRAVKDAYEVERLAAAGAAADAAYEDVSGLQFEGRREREVAADLARLLLEHGHSQVDFTIVGSGPNGANPHHDAGDRVIELGDMVVMDFGGLKDGYGSDTTRTVHVGQPTAEERKVHDVVREAQQAAFEAVRPGVACQEVDRVARQVIRAAGFGEYFIHRTGHGIGVTTHEPPYLVEGEHLPLVPGMCFSIEPGIYLPGRFGVRIEDIVVCTESGGRRLNNTAHGMRVVA
ncbi:aminopeptidase P family protein [Streptomyces roseoverticillatus]|uniref:aminopeptidase P family protein n=1 Tax=Streptomyces roseoverticillatus TaxID=66429 RepID=UPI001F2B82F1|nr:aminopeptidase P family protein [Streptomyces roseoverticillatus]MCF3106242.1 aminopeptidase P family protein [Streptomyces roseoverticillatus]